MKKHMIQTLSLILATVLMLSLVGCGFDDVPSGGDPAPPLEEYCYSILTDSETYNFGDEISISVSLQAISEHIEIPKQSPGALTVMLEDSPYFEIIGENSITFENILLKNYLCGNDEGNRLVATFKIKISEPTFMVGMLNILTVFSEYEDDSGIKKYENPLQGVNFIADSQGIIIAQYPYSSNHYEEKDRVSINPKFLFEESLDREYLAGVPVETLIDRYVEFRNGNRLSLNREYVDGQYFVTYVSKDLRLKIYFSPEHEAFKEFLYYHGGHSDEDMKEFSKTFLRIALDNGAITEKEYNIEMNRIADSETEEGGSTYVFINSDVSFDIPKGDDYFNYVLDLR